MNNVFISHASTDRPWSEWIAWVLEENGYTVTAQALDDRSGESLIGNVQQAITQPGFTLIVLSENYITVADNQSDGPSNLPQDPTSTARRVIPIRVEICQLPQKWELSKYIYIDLVDQAETEAEQTILAALKTHSESEASPPKPAESPISIPSGIAQAEGLPVELGQTQTLDKSDGGQLKLRRRSKTVHGYLERLTDEIGIEMMQIPAGSFLMGSPEDELERDSSEGPQHQVELPAFFMGKYPITQVQWRFVAELPQVNRELEPSPAHFKGDNHPVEQVSWFDVVEFCDRLSLHTGRPYRLPTEAEWEYACRAGTTTTFHVGETITTDWANYRGTDWEKMKWAGSYGRGPKGEYRQRTTPVDHFGNANAFGLCDLHGNVWEWCQDHRHKNYEGAPADGSAWLDEETDDKNVARVLRGGSWYDNPRNCRSASRIFFFPRDAGDVIGFRVVCSAPRALQ